MNPVGEQYITPRGNRQGETAISPGGARMEANEYLLDRIKYARDAYESKELRIHEVKQALLLPILQAVGWNIWEVGEVTPEFQSDDGYTYDYTLQIEGKPKVLIGVYEAQVQPEDYSGPISVSAFRNDCDLAVLTDGCEWQFYLPDETGEPDLTLCHHLSFARGIEADVAQLLMQLLGRPNIANGSSRDLIQELHEKRQKARDVEDQIPITWKQLVTQPDALLIKLIADRVEQQHGSRPEDDMVERFLENNQDQLTDTVASDSPSARPGRHYGRKRR